MLTLGLLGDHACFFWAPADLFKSRFHNDRQGFRIKIMINILSDFMLGQIWVMDLSTDTCTLRIKGANQLKNWCANVIPVLSGGAEKIVLIIFNPRNAIPAKTVLFCDKTQCSKW